jgi:RimJ/RimL family protein N-acetyltransferase
MRVQSPFKEQGFTIEVATIDHDLIRAADVINAAYTKVMYLREEVQRITPQEISRLISYPEKRLYLCLSPKGEICGTILLDFIEETKAEIGLFSIHPNYQGKQIGQNFMRHVEQDAFKGANTVILKVVPLFQEKLIKFYEKLGYCGTGETIDFPIEDKIKYIRIEHRDSVNFCIMQKNKLRSAL